MNTKHINQLKNELIDWQQNIEHAIAIELIRIKRPVELSELEWNPFNNEVSGYVNSIFLDEQAVVFLDTSFNDLKWKELSDFIEHSEIDSWGLISLLDGLQDIRQ